MNKNEGKKIAVLNELGRECYEASVMYRMQGRSGAYTTKGASGNVLEIMANDETNLKNILKPDTVTKLTKSPVAPQVDAVTMQGGKVVERIQYKDTPSKSGMQKTLRQVESGKYQQVQLKGTKETAEKFNQLAENREITKRMESTGISSKTTNRIGDKFTGQMPQLTNLGNVVKTSASLSAGVTAGVETVKSIANGDSLGECASHIISKSAESAITAAVSTAVAETTLGVASSLLAASAVPMVVPLVAAGAIALSTGAVVGELTDGLFDDIGEGIGEVVDNVAEGVGDAIRDLGTSIECFFNCIFL